MPHLDPTYLRYIYDNLIKGSIHPDNASELPDGLIGLYEEAFEEHLPILQRQKQLQRFALFALLKKEVSVHFVAEILGESETEILEFINTFSSWFNSPEPGKFQLYHERLKVYLLQKLSEFEILKLQDTLTAQLNIAIADRSENELSIYAYEFFAQYLAINSQLFNDHGPLDHYVSNNIIWEEQIKASKGFAWSHRDILLGLREAARRKDQFATLRSIANSIIIDSREQNSAEEVLYILREGDIQLAVQRAERWSGSRRLKLYLLMLHDLIIDKSKGLNRKREFCIAVLSSIQKSEDYPIFLRDDELESHFRSKTLTFPSTLIYQYYSELEMIQIDGMFLFEIGDLDLSKVLKHFMGTPNRIIQLFQISTKNEYHFRDLTKELIKYIQSIDHKEYLLTEITKLALSFEDDFEKCLCFSELIKLFYEAGIIVRAESILEDALTLVALIEPRSLKDRRKETCFKALIEPALILNKLDLAKTCADNADVLDYELNSGHNSHSLICNFLVKNGQIETAVKLAHSFTDDTSFYSPKPQSFYFISIALMEMDQFNESLRFASEVNDPTARYDTYLELAKITWAKQNLSMHEDILKILDQEQKPTNKEEIFSKSYKTALMFFNIGNHTRASEYCFKALKLAHILSDYQKRTHLENICALLVKLGFYEEAFLLIDEHKLTSEFIYPEIFKHLSKDLDSNEIMENLNEIAISRNELFISNQIIELLANRSSFNLVRQLMIKSLQKPRKIVFKAPNIDSTQKEESGSFSDDEIEDPDFDLDFLKEFDRIHKEILNEMSFELTLSEVEAELTTLELTKDNIDHAVELCSRIQNDRDQIKGYLTLCALLHKAGLTEEIEDILENKVKDRIPASYTTFLHDETYRIYSILYLKKKDFNNALKKANEINEISTKLDAFFEIKSAINGLHINVLEEKVEQIITSLIMQLLEWLDESIANKQFLDAIKRMTQVEYLKNRRNDFFKASSNMQNELHRSFACKALAIFLYLENEKVLFKKVVDLINIDQVKEETYEEICTYVLSNDLSVGSLQFLSDIIKETSLTNTFEELAKTFGLERSLQFYHQNFSPIRELEFVQGITSYIDELETDLTGEFPILYHFAEHNQLQMSYLMYKARQYYLKTDAPTEEYNVLFNEVFEIES